MNQAVKDGCLLNVEPLAVAHVAAVLADVFKRADQRAGDLAAIADQARARGLTCEQAYISLGEN